MTPEQAFSIVLKRLRKHKGVSQEALAHRCRLDRTYISLLERGLRQPSLKTMLLIASSLDISPTYLMNQVEKSLNEDSEGSIPH